MTCTELHEVLFAFLDSELDAPLSIEVQRHLDHCPTCARQAEIERTIHKRLAAGLKSTDAALDPPEIPIATSPVPTATTWTESPASPAPAPGRTRNPALGGPAARSWKRSAAYVATTCLAAALVYLAGRSSHPANQGAPESAGGAGQLAGRLPDQLAADFEHFLADGQTLQIASADPVAVADWLRTQTDLPVALPSPGDRTGQLLGGRRCEINDRPVAFAYYRRLGRIISVAALCQDCVDLAGMTQTQRDGVTIWSDHRRGFTVLAWSRGALVYSAVSTLDENELLGFVTELRP